MTNNLKAERTLTAEELQDEFERIIREEVFPDYSGEELLGVDRAVKSMASIALRSQSLSTQQPMGEPVLWRVKDYADGWIFVCTREAAEEAAVNGNLIQPLYALHPNQESGE